LTAQILWNRTTVRVFSGNPIDNIVGAGLRRLVPLGAARAAEGRKPVRTVLVLPKVVGEVFTAWAPFHRFTNFTFGNPLLHSIEMDSRLHEAQHKPELDIPLDSRT